MKEQSKQKIGEIIKYYSKDKKTVKVGSIYFSWVNQLTLSRTQIYNPTKSVKQFLDQEYPIDDPYSSQCHARQNCTTIFEVFSAGGCEVTFLAQEQIEKEQNDFKSSGQMQNKKEKNRQIFLDQFGLREKITDCYTIYHEDVGGQVVIIMIFRDQKYWYRLDTDRIWPGYEY